VTELTNEGLELEVFVQGPRSYHPAMQALDVAYNNGTFVHGGNPVLQWNAANLVPRYDVNLNMAPDKKRSADKIDGMCATLMAMGLAILEVDDGSSGFFKEPVAA
jgi:phage terminase large subunit-like protein